MTINGIGKSISSLSQIALKGITTTAATVSGLGIAAIKVGSDFESAFAGAKKTINATDAQLKTLRDGMLAMSERIPTSASDIAKVAEAAGQLGIATDNILEFTETMVMLGSATNLTADEAASALAKFANVTKMDPENYDKLGSTIVALGNNFATTESDIVAMATRLASTGSIINLSKSQIMAVATALSSVGIEAEAGGSAISKVMKDMETAVKLYEPAKNIIDSTGMSLRELEMLKDSSGSDFKGVAHDLNLTSAELKNYMENAKQFYSFAEVAGVSAEEFTKLWGKDAIKAIDLFVTGLNDTERNGKSAIEILDEMGITEVRMSNALLSLSTSDGILTKSVDLANEAWDENTALTNEAAQRYETLDSKVQILKNSAQNLGIAVYENMEVPLKSLADKGTEYMQRLTESFRTFGAEGLISEFSSILTEIISAGMQKLPEFLSMGSSVLGAIASGIIENADTIMDAVLSVLLQLPNFIIDNISLLLEIGGIFITKLSEGIIDNADQIGASAVKLVTTFCKFIISNAPKITKAAGELLKGFAKAIAQQVPILKPFSKAIEVIVDNLDILIPAILGVVTGLKAMKIVNSVSTMITQFSKAAKDAGGATELFKKGLSDMGSPVSMAIGLITGLATAVYSYYKEQKRIKDEKLAEITADSKEQLEAIKDRAEAWQDSIDASSAAADAESKQWDKTRLLYDELKKLVGVNGEVNDANKDRVEYILGELSSATDTEIGNIENGVIPAYQDLMKAIDDTIEKKKMLSRLSQFEDDYTEAQERTASIPKEIAEVKSEIANAEQAKKDLEDTILKEAQKKYGEIVDPETGEVKYNKVQKGDMYYRMTLEKHEGEYSKRQEDIENRKEALSELETEYSKLIDFSDAFEESQTAAQEGNIRKAKEYFKYVESEELRTVANTKASNAEKEQAMKNYYAAAYEEYRLNLEAGKEDADEIFENTIHDLIEATSDGGGQMSDEIITALESIDGFDASGLIAFMLALGVTLGTTGGTAYGVNFEESATPHIKQVGNELAAVASRALEVQALIQGMVSEAAQAQLVLGSFFNGNGGSSSTGTSTTNNNNTTYNINRSTVAAQMVQQASEKNKNTRGKT